MLATREGRETQMRILSRYGLGCAVERLNPQELPEFFGFAIGRTLLNESLLKKAVPNAFKAIIDEGRSIREYFGAHNDRLSKLGNMEGTLQMPISCITSCLVKKGTLLSAREPTVEDKAFLIKTFGQHLTEQIKSVGEVGIDYGTKELVVLDALPEAKVGDRVLVHWNVATELSD